MDFEAALRSFPMILAGGSMYERMRRDPRVAFDPEIKHAALIYDQHSRAHLEEAQAEYLAVAAKHGLPMLVTASTWRASAERVARSAFAGMSVNQDNIEFSRALAGRYASEQSAFFVAGVLGCRGDAYRPSEALSDEDAARFHAGQIAALAEAQPDLLMAATLPALSEARGIARCMEESRLPYLLSFVVRESGTLLDGTPLREAFDTIDSERERPPLGYMVNCVHPSIVERSLDACGPGIEGRILGLRANTAALRPEELDGADELVTSEPAELAEGMRRVQGRGLRILGGCCGTNVKHIEAIAARCKGEV